MFSRIVLIIIVVSSSLLTGCSSIKKSKTQPTPVNLYLPKVEYAE
jgi:hypothetical protein